jgi:uncharacterized protein YecE (DUF72 family)
MGRILVGTASWTDKSLIGSGRFYPTKCTTPEDRLRYYASQFPLVEVDSSYYAIPEPCVAQLWAERTPASFLFNVKAFRLLTGHQTAPAALPKDLAQALGSLKAKNLYYKDAPAAIRDAVWERFRQGIEPLRASRKLVAVHFQFAPWIAFHPENFKHIDECQERLAGFQLSIEFRNKTWFEGKHSQETLDFERGRGLANVVVDEPQGLRNTIPSVWEVTTPKLAIVRLHGRNHGTWNHKDLQTSAERFNYDYNTAELTDLATMIRELGTQADLTQVIFNNNYEDQGQRNARELTRLLAASQAQ